MDLTTLLASSTSSPQRCLPAFENGCMHPGPLRGADSYSLPPSLSLSLHAGDAGAGHQPTLLTPFPPSLAPTLTSGGKIFRAGRWLLRCSRHYDATVAHGRHDLLAARMQETDMPARQLAGTSDSCLGLPGNFPVYPTVVSASPCPAGEHWTRTRSCQWRWTTTSARQIA